jgi:hypothetical protein
MEFGENRFQAAEVGGDSAHYWCDYWYPSGGTKYERRGGAAATEVENAGAFYSNLYYGATYANNASGAALSCKPLV